MIAITSFAVVSLLSVWSASLVPAVGAQNQLVSLTKAEKQAILDTHNTLRARTARGDTGGQPSAADMMLLDWDERLADKAATWAVQCRSGHDEKSHRLIPGFHWVGQNWAGSHNPNMSYFVEELWFNEYKDFNYNGRSCNPDKICGHYTQVVWAWSLSVGCAAAQCPDYPRVLVCNYALGGNIGTQPPYVSGSPASQCIGEYTLTQGSQGVCLRKDQCPDAAGCKCAIACKNGGTLDESQCRCNCSPEFYGVRCELPCADEPGWQDGCKTDPEACKNFPLSCMRTCNRCSRDYDIRNKEAVNPDKIVSRVIGN